MRYKIFFTPWRGAVSPRKKEEMRWGFRQSLCIFLCYFQQSILCAVNWASTNKFLDHQCHFYFLHGWLHRNVIPVIMIIPSYLYLCAFLLLSVAYFFPSWMAHSARGLPQTFLYLPGEIFYADDQRKKNAYNYSASKKKKKKNTEKMFKAVQSTSHAGSFKWQWEVSVLEKKWIWISRNKHKQRADGK